MNAVPEIPVTGLSAAKLELAERIISAAATLERAVRTLQRQVDDAAQVRH